jgi:type I restriction enzyme S subunit
MQSDSYFGYIHGIEGGSSTRPNMKINFLLDYMFDVPSFQEQQHIVNILGSIDDKIENNEQKILKLEKLMLNEFSNFSSNISDFEIKKAEEVFNISIGRTPPRQEFQWFENTKNNNNKKWISIADMGSSDMFIFNTNECLTNNAIAKFNIPLIKHNTAILSFKLTVGRVNITSEEMLSNEAIAHFNTDNKLLLPYTYCYLKSFNYNDLGSTSSIATATNSKSIKNMKFILPNDVDVKHFYTIGNPILEKILSLQKQINKLKKLKNIYLKKFFG